ncbi:MAG: hypothetical protein IJJ99_07350 [Oscillospiraceae bacterium]|nr:hypothetical protein [Oscillospiraceae bacterium]
MKHIIIRGARGVGKSTLICRLMDAVPAKPGGFVTKKAPPDADGVETIHIYPAGQPQIPTEENCVGACRSGRLLDRRTAVFDTLGAAYLSDTAGRNVLLMDELGFMESEALAFQQAVLNALDGDLPVLAAVKDKSTPFLERVCAHPDARVWVITPENRSKLFDELLPPLKDLIE